MLKKIWPLICFSLLVATAHAFDFECESANEGLYFGLREDSLSWKISRKFDHPALIREECFDSIKMVEAGIFSEVNFCNRLALAAYADYAESYNKTHNHAYDVSIGIGYNFYALNCLWMTPYVGFSIERQHFKTCTSNSFINENYSLSKFNALNRSHWYSPWIGLNFKLPICEGLRAHGSFAYHFGRLRGNGHNRLGDKNTGDTLIWESFHQTGNMFGYDFEAGLQYDICCNWQFDMWAEFKTRKTYNGHQHGHYLIEGASLPSFVVEQNGKEESNSDEEGQRVRHKLKHVEWHSFKIAFALNYYF